jgi:pimeloyl-ACP methyl ester carboxylesterase
VKAWLDEMELNKVVLAGHSMGGAIALMMALEHPLRTHSLILLGTGARLRVHPDFLAGSASQANFPSVVEMVIDWGFSPQASSRLVELATRRMMEIPHWVLHGDFKACDGFDVTMRLDEVTCPTLVICGEHDRLTPLRYAHFLVDQIKGAKLEIIPGSGHMVMLEKPREVQIVMQRFLQQLIG